MTSALDGYEVIELSTVITRSAMGRTVLAFIESGNECMGRRYGDLKQLRRDQNTARAFIRTHGLNVRAYRRNDMLMLVRLDGDV